MRLFRSFAVLTLALCMLGAVAKSRAAESRSGDWTIRKSGEAGKVEFSLFEHHAGGTSSHESDWPVTSFIGVDFSNPGRQDVRFTLSRDAGKIECEGFLNNGEGAGIFHFQPDPNYLHEMNSLGFAVDEDRQYNMAVEDVSLDFVRQMKGEQLTNLDTDKLLAFRIHGVDARFVEDLRAAGLKIFDSDKLVAFRIHGVTPQMVRFLRESGYSPDEDLLVAMRIHGATPEWMEELKSRGYDHVDIRELIAFRIHGVSPEFIAKLQALGYSHPQPDELVAMRIHNVTPEYISGLRARGIENLSIHQLVNMRIQGID
jgi:hypothetical protein